MNVLDLLLSFKRRPSDAAQMPFPSPDTTPPVTNTYFIRCSLFPSAPLSPSGKSGAHKNMLHCSRMIFRRQDVNIPKYGGEKYRFSRYPPKLKKWGKRACIQRSTVLNYKIRHSVFQGGFFVPVARRTHGRIDVVGADDSVGPHVKRGGAAFVRRGGVLPRPFGL